MWLVLVVNGVFYPFIMVPIEQSIVDLRVGVIEGFGPFCLDLEGVMIDATIVRSHACSAGYGKNTQDIQALGRSKGGFTTKIHALVDALGNPLKFILTPGQRHEITQASTL